MIVDLLLGVFALFLVFSGFKLGFIPSLLGLVGYLAGGFLGLIFAKEFSTDWTGLWSVIGLHLLSIFIGAKMGQFVARNLGKGIRALFGPLKFVDSLLGALLGGVKATLLITIALIFSSVLPSDSLQREIDRSEVNTYINSHLPAVVFDAFSKVREFSTR